MLSGFPLADTTETWTCKQDNRQTKPQGDGEPSPASPGAGTVGL